MRNRGRLFNQFISFFNNALASRFALAERKSPVEAVERVEYAETGRGDARVEWVAVSGGSTRVEARETSSGDIRVEQ